MEILIVGAHGMLGKDLVDTLKQHHHVLFPTRKELDITEQRQIAFYLDKVKPDIVINCAAFTNVDEAENRDEECFKVNSIGARNIAIACNAINIPVVYISSDYVFDGLKGKSYIEFDQTNPVNIYGLSKLAGEEIVKQLTTKHYIIRTSWLFGGESKNFVTTMMNLAKNQKVLKVVSDQYGSPTYTKDLANAIGKLIQSPSYGTYHLTNSGYCSWHQFAEDIFSLLNIDITVESITTTDLQRPAKRPEYSVLENYVWKLEGHQPLRDYKEALKDYLEKLKQHDDMVEQ